MKFFLILLFDYRKYLSSVYSTNEISGNTTNRKIWWQFSVFRHADNNVIVDLLDSPENFPNCESRFVCSLQDKEKRRTNLASLRQLW